MMFLHVAHDLRERQICFFPESISVPSKALAMPGPCIFPWSNPALCPTKWALGQAS